MENKQLFNELSDPNDNYGWRAFSFNRQATIQAVGLAPEDEITFEIIYLIPGSMSYTCGCFIAPPERPCIAATERLMCYECSADQKPVTVTAEHPIVVLNAPQDTLIRAKFTGPGLGTAQVWVTLETDSRDIPPGMTGCLGPMEWTDTGRERAVKDFDPGNLDVEPGTVQIQQVNQCGETRWVECGQQNWMDTGETRCMGHQPQKKRVNGFGNIVWEDTPGVCGYASAEFPGAIADLALVVGGSCQQNDLLAGVFPEDNAPDEASIKITDCDDNVIGHAFPKPIPGASTPIYGGCEQGSCCRCEDVDLQGYGVDIPCDC